MWAHEVVYKVVNVHSIVCNGSACVLRPIPNPYSLASKAVFATRVASILLCPPPLPSRISCRLLCSS